MLDEFNFLENEVLNEKNLIPHLLLIFIECFSSLFIHSHSKFT